MDKGIDIPLTLLMSALSKRGKIPLLDCYPEHCSVMIKVYYIRSEHFW